MVTNLVDAQLFISIPIWIPMFVDIKEKVGWL